MRYASPKLLAFRKIHFRPLFRLFHATDFNKIPSRPIKVMLGKKYSDHISIRIALGTSFILINKKTLTKSKHYGFVYEIDCYTQQLSSCQMQVTPRWFSFTVAVSSAPKRHRIITKKSMNRSNIFHKQRYALTPPVHKV